MTQEIPTLVTHTFQLDVTLVDALRSFISAKCVDDTLLGVFIFSALS